jgi:hypothetical protein
MTSTIGGHGRFGNHFIRNICISIIAKNYDLAATYSVPHLFSRLGIPLFSGSRTFESSIQVTDDTVVSYLLGHASVSHNLFSLSSYLQIPDTARIIRQFLTSPEIQSSIIFNNPYKDRFNNNNDLYIHLRLGDVSYLAPDFQYFADAILAAQKVNGPFSNGFISTESWDHPLTQRLIHTFNLKPLVLDEVNTFQFASTCRNVILSNGTFSWCIGVLSFFSTVVFPELIEEWSGDIMVFPDWIEILRPNYVPTHVDMNGNPYVVRKSKGIPS